MNLPAKCNTPFRTETLPVFSGRGLPIFNPTGQRIRADIANSDEHKKHPRKPSRRTTFDARHVANVANAISVLPADGESVHALIKGNTPFWAMIPRLIELAAEPILDLRISTLTFGRDFSDWLLASLDAGKVRTVKILCSNYFKCTSERTYKLLSDHLTPAQLQVARTHAKIIAANTPSAGFVFEGSANLRACRAIEQVVLTNDAPLCRFYQGCIDQLFHEAHGQTTAKPGQPQ
jgi:hypothetical protein